MIIKKGIIAFEIFRILVSAMAPDTIKHIPNGGVNIPIARFVTIMTPDVRGSIPMVFSKGATTGTNKIKDAVVSTKVPITSKKIFIRISKTYLLPLNERKVFERISCILFIERNHENTVAIDIIIKIMELVFTA